MMTSKPDLLNLLFSTFPPGGSGDPKAQIAAYAIAIDNHHDGDVEAAVLEIIRGSAPGINPNFAPSAAALGAEASRQMNLRLDREERDRRFRPALPPPDIEKTPESRARVKAMTERLAQNLDARSLTDDAAAHRDRLRRTNARFDAEAVTRGFTVGDPEGEGEVA